jgi:hypothetical protein
MATTFQFRAIDVAVSAGAVTPGPGNATAIVALVQRSTADAAASDLGRAFYESLAATHTHSGDGRYDPLVPPTPGEWLLVVRDAGRCPVVQRVTLSDDAGMLRVKVGWKGSGQVERDLQAAAVDIVNFKAAKANTKPPLQSLVTAKLFPRREFVFMSGTEFHGAGTTWRLFAEGHRNLLRQAKVINDGDLITFLVCEQRKRKTFVKAAGGSNAWLLIDEFLKSGADRKSPDPQVEQADSNKDLGILDLYEYLDKVGATAPGTVEEVSVFSHAFFDGPILWDTFQRDGSGGAAGTTNFQDDPVQRDPKDLDGRTKDWNSSGTMSTFGNLPASLSAQGLLKVWGCNAETFIGQMIRRAQSKLAPKFPHDVFFDFTFTETNPGDDSEIATRVTKSHLTIAHLLKTEIDLRLRKYCGTATTFLAHRVFGALPGTGSNFGAKGGGNNVMFVNEKDHAPIFAFYNREVGAKTAKDADGYCDFQALLSAASGFSTPPWSTERHVLISDVSANTHKAVTFVQVATGAFAARRTPAGSFKMLAQTGLVDSGRSGHLFVANFGRFDRILDHGGFPLVALEVATDRDAGVYVQDDGVVFMMTRLRGATAWVTESAAITHFSGTPVTDGVLHRGTPAFLF